MKKKFLLAAFVSLCAIGLASCGGETSSVESSTPDSTISESTPDTSSEASSSSSSSSSSADTYSLSISYSGTAEAGQSITLIATMYINGTQRAIADQENVTYTAADDASAALVEISGFTANLLGSGDCTLNASYTYDGTLISTEYTFTIAEGVVVNVTTIAEIKELAVAAGNDRDYILDDSGACQYFVIRGKIAVTSGSSAYIVDETGGMYIYNWYFSSTDTACTSYNWVAGTTVEICGYVQNYYGVAEITNSSSDTQSYANLYTGTVNIQENPKLTEEILATLDSMDSYGDTTKRDQQIYYNGTVYDIEGAVYEGMSSEFSTSTRNFVKFSLGSYEFELRTDGSTSACYDDYIDDIAAVVADLQVGDVVNISNVPLYQIYSGIQFHWFGSGTTVTVTQRTQAESLSVSLAESTIAVTGSTQASATVSPSTISQNITWTSSNTSVATVDENGVVTGVAAGSATITATSEVTNTVTGSATITVVAGDDTNAPAPTAVSISLGSTTIGVGYSSQALATVTPASAAQTVTWTSSDASVATVDENGLIAGVALGDATITATSTVSNTVYGTIDVTVANYSLATITFDSTFNTGFTSISSDGWEKTVGDVTINHSKASSTTNISTTTSDSGETVLGYIDPIRMYKSSVTTFTLPEGATFVSIETEEVIISSSNYSLNSTNASTTSTGATIGDCEVTFDGSATNVFAFTALNQTRLTYITITYAPAE